MLENKYGAASKEKDPLDYLKPDQSFRSRGTGAKWQTIDVRGSKYSRIETPTEKKTKPLGGVKAAAHASAAKDILAEISMKEKTKHQAHHRRLRNMTQTFNGPDSLTMQHSGQASKDNFDLIDH